MPASTPKKFEIFIDSSLSPSRKKAIRNAVSNNKKREELKAKEIEEEKKKREQERIEQKKELGDLIGMEVSFSDGQDDKEQEKKIDPQQTIEALETKLEELKDKKHKLFVLLKKILSEDEKKKREEQAEKRKLEQMQQRVQREQEQKQIEQQQQFNNISQKKAFPYSYSSVGSYATSHPMHGSSQHLTSQTSPKLASKQPFETSVHRSPTPTNTQSFRHTPPQSGGPMLSRKQQNSQYSLHSPPRKPHQRGYPVQMMHPSAMSSQYGNGQQMMMPHVSMVQNQSPRQQMNMGGRSPFVSQNLHARMSGTVPHRNSPTHVPPSQTDQRGRS